MYRGTVLMCSYLHKKCVPSEEGGCLGEIPTMCRHVCTWFEFREYHCPYRYTRDDSWLGLDYIAKNKCLVCGLEVCPLLNNVSILKEE